MIAEPDLHLWLDAAEPSPIPSDYTLADESLHHHFMERRNGAIPWIFQNGIQLHICMLKQG